MREFLARFRNHLSPKPYRDSSRRAYVKLHDQVSLLAFCLMSNHFHLVIHQRDAHGMENLMRRTLTSYGIYYTNRYNWRGTIFDARYAAKPILDVEHAKSAIAYVHLNDPIQQLDYEFSSHSLMLGEADWDWIDTTAALNIFGGVDAYKSFLDRRGPKIIEDKLIEKRIDPAIHPYRPISPRASGQRPQTSSRAPKQTP
jgi:REP element-mobilizing transposase RayT